VNTTILWRFFFESAGSVTRKATGSTLGGSPLASLPLSGSEKRAVTGSSITPTLHVNAQVFHSASLTFTLQPAAVDEADTFPAAALRVTLSAPFLPDTDTFGNASILSAGTVAPPLVGSTTVVFGPVVTAAGLVQPPLVGSTTTIFSPSVSGPAVAPQAEVSWPQFRRPKRRREDDDAAPEAAETPAPLVVRPVDDALTRALDPEPDLGPTPPGPPPVTMDELMAQALEAGRLELERIKAARLAAIRNDDERVLALFLERF
jgi:hypothetical protein